jgi:hypothetical protein
MAAAVWVCAALAVSAAVRGAEGPLPESGVLALTLDEAVPFAASGVPRGNRDLHLDVPLEGGRVRADAWAWIDCMPAAEHRAAVIRAEPDGRALHLEISVTVGHYLPKYTGGQGRFEIDLVRDGMRWTGMYCK